MVYYELRGKGRWLVGRVVMVEGDGVDTCMVDVHVVGGPWRLSILSVAAFTG